jgi:hypothetical protein
MNPGEHPDNDNLDRLRDLTAGLGGTLGNGDLLAWVSLGDIDAVPDEVYAVVSNAGLFGDGDPGGPVRTAGQAARAARRSRQPVILPADGPALMSLTWEIDEPTATDLLTSLAGNAASSGQRHHLRRRYAADPQEVFEELAKLIGPDTRWWTNTDLTTWNPITQHTFDAIVVGAGNGVIVTLIAFEGGG